jgi:type IV pilus assembly protein PilC
MNEVLTRARLLRFGVMPQILLLKRLALYLHSGISLPRGLGFIAEDTRDRSALFILEHLESTVARGEPLSRGFSQFPKQFDPFITGFVEAGEASGALPETLERLAEILEKRRSLSKKIVSAFVYPIVILVGTISMATFLTLFIFPKILPVLQGFHTKLPFATRLLITVDSLLAHDWLEFGTVLALAIVGTIFGSRLRIVRYRYEQLLIRIPLLGTLYRDYALSTLLHVLALLLNGGIRIIPAIVLVRAIVPGIQYKDALLSIERDVAEGQRLSFALKKYSRLFPPIVTQMIAAGEATGTLRENLDSLAHIYEEELEDLTKNLTVLIEPALMLCMGLLVGFVALAIITPIYQVTQNLNIAP